MELYKETLMTAAYMALGLKEPDGVNLRDVCDHFDGGEVELVSQLIAHLPLLIKMEEVAYHFTGEYPGSFHYEVTEPFGSWFGAAVMKCAPQTTPSHEDCAAKLREIMLTFFSQQLGSASIQVLVGKLEAVTHDSVHDFDGRDEPGMESKRVEALAAAPDHELTAQQLDDKYNPNGDGEHPTHTRFDWRQAVAADSTLRGYWEWVAAQLEEDRND